MRELNLRSYHEEDFEQLNLFRSQYWDADVEVPFGYAGGKGVGTAVAEKDGKTIGALTSTKAVVLDFIKNPDAIPTDVSAAVFMLERTMTCIAESTGTVVSYVAVPSHLTEYIKYVKSCGYDEACQNCTILRRPLVPEVMPSLGDQRDAATTQITVE